MKSKNIIIKITVGVAYVAMVAVNALANILPINGVNTGQVSNSYSNLFAPAAVTFSIWGLIYLLLAVYTLYQFRLFKQSKYVKNNQLFEKIGLYFIASSIANILWIFSWHYDYIGISVFNMLVILYCLIKIADLVNKEEFSLTDNFLIRLPFSIYFGWITVAAIANITTFLVSISWNGFGISDQIWTIAILLVGAGIGIWRMLKDKNIAYGSVFVWAYLGIWIKHASPNEYNGLYGYIIITVIICMAAFLAGGGFLLFKNKKS